MASVNFGADVYVDGELEIEDDLTVGGQVVSLVDSIAPFVVTSTVLNENLNADLLDGEHGAYYLDLANATGVLGVAYGGTGLSTVGSAGQLLRSTGTGLEYFTHDFISSTLLGAVNGVATLDATGKVPLAQLPSMGMQYKGTWDASTNTPTLADGLGTEGDFYRVIVPGTVDFGSGNISFTVGDDVIYNGSVWERAPAGHITPTLQQVTDQGAVTSNNITIEKAGSISTILVRESISGAYSVMGASESTARIGSTDGALAAGFSVSPSGAYLFFEDITSADAWALSYVSDGVASLDSGHQLRVQQDPVHDNDLARKLYVDTGLSAKFDIPTGTTAQYVRGDGSLDTFPTIPTVGNGVLTMSVGTGLTGSATFSANQSGNSTFTVGLGANLANLNAVTNTGFLKRTGTNTWSVDTTTYMAASNAYTKTESDAKYALLSNSVSAGNGLTGGGAISSNPSITLGTPGNITLASTNSVSSDSHTHAFVPGGTTSQYIRGDGSLATLPTIGDGTLTLAVGTGLTGSASFTANQSGNSTFTVGLGTNLSNLNALSTSGFVKKTGANTWTIDTSTYLTSVALGDITNVTLSSPTNGQTLVYNGTVWVNTTLPSIPTNYVTTDTNQNSLGGNKTWTGHHIIAPGNTSSPFTVANSVRISRNSDGAFMTIENDSAVSTVRLRAWNGGTDNKYQISLLTGGIETGNHGTSENWYTAWQRINSTNLGKTGNGIFADNTTLNSEQAWSDLPIGYSAFVYSNVGLTNGAPDNTNGYFTKVANRDVSGGWAGLWIDYAFNAFYVGKASNTTTCVTWSRVLTAYTPTTLSSGQLLQWNGTGWTNWTANCVPSSATVSAGNGLTGGGAVSANPTITLGTPGAITLSSTNSVTGESHTHAFNPGGTTSQYIRGDGSLATFPTTSMSTLTAGSGLTGAAYNGSSNQTWAVDLAYLRARFVATSLDDPGNLGTTSSIGANDIQGTSIVHTTSPDNRPVASQGIISTFIRNGTTGYQTYYAPVVAGDSFYYRGLSVSYSPWYQVASREWVTSQNYALASAIPTNYVT